MEALLDVVKVEVEPGYLLRLEFENGERGHRLRSGRCEPDTAGT